jgi:hypothetical protein
MFFPVLVLLTPLSSIGDRFLLWLIILSLYMPLGALIRSWVRSNLRLIQILLGALIVAGLSLLVYGISFAAWGAILAGSFLYFHGFTSVRAGWHAKFPVGVMWVCLFLYLIAGLMLHRFPIYASYSTVLGWLGVCAVVVALFISNIANLQDETHSGERDVRLAPGVVWKNRLLIGAVIVLVAAIGFFGPIMQGFIWIKEQVKSLISALFALMTGDEAAPSPEATPKPQEPMQMPMPEPDEPSALADFLNRLFVYVGMALAIAVALVALYFLSRMIYRLVKLLVQRLLSQSREAAQGVQEYEEEKTSLIDWREVRKQYGDRIASLFTRKDRDPAWDSLDASGRIRLLYRQFVRRNVSEGRPFEAHLTPREQLTTTPGKDVRMNEEEREQLADAYNTVRYGNKQADEELSNRLKRNSGL